MMKSIKNRWQRKLLHQELKNTIYMMIEIINLLTRKGISVM